MIEHCISALIKSGKEKAYRSYVTTALKAITENTARYITINGPVEYGTKMMKSFDEIVGNVKVQQERSADEIINTIKTRIIEMRDKP